MTIDMTATRSANVRWVCAGCSKYIPASAISTHDEIMAADSMTHWANCPRCGRTDSPRCVEVGWKAGP